MWPSKPSAYPPLLASMSIVDRFRGAIGDRLFVRSCSLVHSGPRRASATLTRDRFKRAALDSRRDRAARGHRQITQYAAIPPIVRDAILAAEDRRFFSHNGVDYFSVPRVLTKVRVGALIGRVATGGRHDNTSGRAIFPQGGSTITQQLVRGDFLQRQTARENSYQLRNVGLAPRALSSVIGARNVNMVLRKR